MMRTKSRFSRIGSTLVLSCTVGMANCQLGSPTSNEESSVGEAIARPQDAAPAPSPANGRHIVIDTTSLPGTYPRAAYSVKLQEHGGVPSFHWKVEKGQLPPGLRLEDDGTLHGSPEKIGE